jgi:hypothetical protein
MVQASSVETSGSAPVLPSEVTAFPPYITAGDYGSITREHAIVSSILINVAIASSEELQQLQEHLHGYGERADGTSEVELSPQLRQVAAMGIDSLMSEGQLRAREAHLMLSRIGMTMPDGQEPLPIQTLAFLKDGELSVLAA